MKKLIKKAKDTYRNIKPYSYILNFVLFAAKILLSIFSKSFIFIISSLYNLGIGFAKKKNYSEEKSSVSTGMFLIMASIAFILYSIYIIVSHKVSSYSLYTGLAIATVSFTEIGYSIYGIIKSKNQTDEKSNILKLINFATALISLELTQAALLSFTNSGMDSSLYNGLIGIVVGSISCIIGIIILLKKEK